MYHTFWGSLIYIWPKPGTQANSPNHITSLIYTDRINYCDSAPYFMYPTSLIILCGAIWVQDPVHEAKHLLHLSHNNIIFYYIFSSSHLTNRVYFYDSAPTTSCTQHLLSSYVGQFGFKTRYMKQNILYYES